MVLFWNLNTFVVCALSGLCQGHNGQGQLMISAGHSCAARSRHWEFSPLREGADKSIHNQEYAPPHFPNYLGRRYIDDIQEQL